MSWVILAFAIPIVVAFQSGATYGFAVSLVVVGLVLYVTNGLLIRHFVSKADPDMLENGTWEMTAGLGIVPKWVSLLGLLAIGFLPAGIVVLLLLALGVVANRGG